MSEIFDRFDQLSFFDLPNATFSQVSVSGLTPSDKQGGATTNQSGQDHHLVNLSASQVNDLGLLTSGTFGQRGSTSSLSAALQKSLLNRLQAATDTTGSTLWLLIWKTRSTPSLRSIFRLAALEHLTSETDFTSWPITSVRDGKGGYLGGRIRKGQQSYDVLDVVAQLASWPTPQAMDALAPMEYERRLNHPSRPGRNVSGNLREVVTQCTPVRLTASGEMLTGCCAGTKSSGQLHPAHSRWLMGLPEEWDCCGVMAMRSFRRLRRRLSSAACKNSE